MRIWRGDASPPPFTGNPETDKDGKIPRDQPRRPPYKFTVVLGGDELEGVLGRDELGVVEGRDELGVVEGRGLALLMMLLAWSKLIVVVTGGGVVLVPLRMRAI